MKGTEDLMKTTIRIVAGSLRGRKLTCDVNPELRPTPQMVREAFFSILGNAIPGRVFVDLFAGTGVVGLEALSRGASQALFVERDFRHAQDLERHIRAFGVTRQAKLFRTDVYRWIAAWRPPSEAVNVFLSPPFADLDERTDNLREALAALQDKVAEDSVIVLQSERGSAMEDAPEMAGWEYRRYSRNVLMIWQKAAAQVSDVSKVEIEHDGDGD
ncbi:MAG: RsmD family RNA methyltransferase [Gemmataceae bacterium]